MAHQRALQMNVIVKYLHETHGIPHTDSSLWSWKVKHDPNSDYGYGDVILTDFAKAQFLTEG